MNNLALLIYIAFNIYIILKFGVLPSLSNSFYKLEEDKSGSGILFSISLLSVGMLMIDVWSAKPYGWLGIIACISLCGVATAPMYDNEEVKLWHYLFAGIAAISSITWLILVNELSLLYIFSVLGLLYYLLTFKNILYILETIIILSSICTVNYISL